MKVCDVCGKQCHHEGRNCTCTEASAAPPSERGATTLLTHCPNCHAPLDAGNVVNFAGVCNQCGHDFARIGEAARAAVPQAAADAREVFEFDSLEQKVSHCELNHSRWIQCETSTIRKLLKARAAAVPAPGTECICEGNWRQIVAETEGLIGQRFRDEQGQEFTFFGVVHGADDYYYGMRDRDEVKLLSCVGSIEGHGFTLVAGATAPPKEG